MKTFCHLLIFDFFILNSFSIKKFRFKYCSLISTRIAVVSLLSRIWSQFIMELYISYFICCMKTKQSLQSRIFSLLNKRLEQVNDSSIPMNRRTFLLLSSFSTIFLIYFDFIFFFNQHLSTWLTRASKPFRCKQIEQKNIKQ